MKVYTFPVGAVVLDIDTPTSRYWDREPLAQVLVEGARELAVRMAGKWQLGRFWVYRTLSGAHIVFERLLPSLEDAFDVLLDAYDQEGWRECGGHISHCTGKQLTLRAGLKEHRPRFDIYPLDVVDGTAPPHVQEHHEEVCCERCNRVSEQA